MLVLVDMSVFCSLLPEGIRNFIRISVCTYVSQKLYLRHVIHGNVLGI